jgi:ABC-2 type transport system ATP-binding protein
MSQTVPERVEDIDAVAMTSGIVKFLGRNGAGKTTLIECLLGVRDIDHGDIRVFGEAPGQFSEAVKAQIGYVPQQTDLFEWMSADEMLGFVSTFYPRWNQAKVDALLDRWSVARNVRISSLSVGEKQRLAIIRALAHEPTLLVLDEPVASLDPAARREFLRELVGLNVDGALSVLFSTHIVSDLERVAFDVAVLHGGKIVLQGALDELMNSVVRLSGTDAALAPFSGFAITPPARRSRDHSVTSLLARDVDARLIDAHRTSVRAETLSAEDLFIEVTR